MPIKFEQVHGLFVRSLSSYPNIHHFFDTKMTRGKYLELPLNGLNWWPSAPRCSALYGVPGRGKYLELPLKCTNAVGLHYTEEKRASAGLRSRRGVRGRSMAHWGEEASARLWSKRVGQGELTEMFAGGEFEATEGIAVGRDSRIALGRPPPSRRGRSVGIAGSATSWQAVAAEQP